MFARKHFLVLAAGIALAGVLVYAPEALAQDQTQQRFDGILDQFRDQSIRWQGVLTMSARWLFFTLAIMQFAWTNMSLALKGGDISDFISHNTKQILGIGIMYVFLVHAFAWSTALVMGFRQAGERAVIASAGAGAESTIDPAGIFQNGMIVAGSLFAQMSIWSGADNIALVICALVMIVCFAFLAAFMAVAIVESYIIIGGAVLFLGFGGSAWTGDIAKKAMMYAVSVGAKLFVMQLIVGVAMGSVITWAQTYENDSSTSTLSLIGLIILITIMAKMIPELVQGILSGVSVGGSSAMVATIAAATAAAATGGAAALGGGAAVAGGAGAAGGAAGGGGAASGAAGAATTGAQGASMYGSASGGAFSEAAGHAARTAASDASSSSGQPLGPLGAVSRASDADTAASSAPAGAGASSTPYANTTAAAPDGGSIRGAGEASGEAAGSASGAGGATAGGGTAAPAPGASGAAGAASAGPVPAGAGGSSSRSSSSAAPAAPGPLQSVSSEAAAPKDAPAASSGQGGSPTSLDERSGASSSSSGGSGGSSAPAGSPAPGGSPAGITLDDAAPTSTPAGTSAQGGEPSSINERAGGPSAVDVQDSTPAPAQRSAIDAEDSTPAPMARSAIDAEDSTPDRSAAFSSASGNLGKMAGHIVDTGSGLNPNSAVAPIAQLGDGGTDDDPDKPRPPSGGGGGGVRTTGEGLADSASSSGGTIRGAGESVAQAATDLGRAAGSAAGDAGGSDSSSRLQNAQRGAALGFVAAGPGGAAIGAAAGAALSPQIDAAARRAGAALDAAKAKFGLTPDNTDKPS